MKYMLFAVVFSLAACNAAPPEAQSSPVGPTEPAAPTVDVVTEPAAEAALPQSLAPAASGWLGKWIGPEGTFLELSEADGVYTVTIQSLDGPATYDAVAIDDRVEFQRDGKLETIRASNGEQTGMKWLLDKQDCLTIKTGEGFCRN